MEAKILIKHSVSSCNQELIQWLQTHVNTIKQYVSLKVVIVYASMYNKLDSRITRLPALVMGGSIVTGTTSIKKKISARINGTGPTVDDNDLDNFWNTEIFSGVEDKDDEPDDIMEHVKRKALDVTSSYREQSKKEKKKVQFEPSSNVRVETTDKISDMIDDDPMMQKFWENQESTPGSE
jgi:hypothetical protein